MRTEQFAAARVAEEGIVELSELTELDDDAAEILSKGHWDLFLDVLTSLSDAAAESLSKSKSWDLQISGLTSLSDAAAESLSKHEGSLSLDGLTSLSDAAVDSLLRYEGSAIYLRPDRWLGQWKLIIDEDGVVQGLKGKKYNDDHE